MSFAGRAKLCECIREWLADIERRELKDALRRSAQRRSRELLLNAHRGSFRVLDRHDSSPVVEVLTSTCEPSDARAETVITNGTFG